MKNPRISHDPGRGGRTRRDPLERRRARPTLWSATIASFFQRLGGIDRIARIILADSRVAALITLRHHPNDEHGDHPITNAESSARSVLLDFARSPLRVTVDDTSHGAPLGVTVDADIMHRIMLGQLTPGEAFGRRQLLLRGSAAFLARFASLLSFAPVLYREHLADLGIDGFARRSATASRKEGAMQAPKFEGKPIPLHQLNRFEKLLFESLNKVAWTLGYGVGLLRYRLFEKLSLFEVLEAMSQGLAAAVPPDNEAQVK